MKAHLLAVHSYIIFLMDPLIIQVLFSWRSSLVILHREQELSGLSLSNTSFYFIVFIEGICISILFVCSCLISIIGALKSQLKYITQWSEIIDQFIYQTFYSHHINKGNYDWRLFRRCSHSVGDKGRELVRTTKGKELQIPWVISARSKERLSSKVERGTEERVWASLCH